MTRANLTNDYQNRISTELRKAYNFFGEYNENFLKDVIKKNLDELRWKLGGLAPEIIETDEGIITGHTITIALGGDENDQELVRDGKVFQVENIQALNLVINKEGLQYVLKSFNYYHLMDTSIEEEFYDDFTYKKVRLEDVDRETFHRAF